MLFLPAWFYEQLHIYLNKDKAILDFYLESSVTEQKEILKACKYILCNCERSLTFESPTELILRELLRKAKYVFTYRRYDGCGQKFDSYGRYSIAYAVDIKNMRQLKRIVQHLNDYRELEGRLLTSETTER